VGQWLSQGNTLLLVTHALRLTPFGVLLLTALRLIEPRSLREEARLFSGSWWEIERRIVLPTARPRLVLVFGMLFSLALAELSSTILTVAPGTETLVLRVYNLLHFGALPSVAALALLQSLVTAIVMLLAFAAARRVFRAAG
jgi:iron(III) transport system permease protein